MMAPDAHALAQFYRQVRTLAASAQSWHSGLIWHPVTPDERWDLFLVARRVYQRADEWFTIMAAAGLDSVDDPLPQRTLALPDEGQLLKIKRRCQWIMRP